MLRQHTAGQEVPRSVPDEISKLRDEMRAEETDRDYLVHGDGDGPAAEGATKTLPVPVRRDGPQAAE